MYHYFINLCLIIDVKYGWDEDKKEWLAINSQAKSETKPDVKEAEEASKEEDEEMDDDSEEKPREVKKQDMSKGHYGFENGTHTYTDPSDGSVYFWEKEKNAWFPKVIIGKHLKFRLGRWF